MKHNPRLNEKMARLPGFADIHPLQPQSDRAGRAGADGPAGPLAEDPDRHAGGGALAQGRRARRALRPAGHPRGAEARGDARRTRAGARPPPTAPTRPPPPWPATRWWRSPRPPTAASTSPTSPPSSGPDVAAVMVTNPNTCGLFERDVIEIARLTHAAGAFFYCDGANFNAIVGRVRPGDLGVDAMHINLHKTFSTPHGGGGPGAGPVVLSARRWRRSRRRPGWCATARRLAADRAQRGRGGRRRSAGSAPSTARWACTCARCLHDEPRRRTACARWPRTRC